jgi:hypothetical protein
MRGVAFLLNVQKATAMMRKTWVLGAGLLIASLIAVCGEAIAEPFGIMFESDENKLGGAELGFNTYASLADILDANSTSSTFSDINVNAPFSTTGITWDGSQFIIMFESDQNDIGGAELGFNTYASLADILDANSTSSAFSDINVNAPFSTTGITWDGSQFIIMFESDENKLGGAELGFNTYASLADILDANSTSSTFSDINVNAPFSTTGIYFVDDGRGDQQVPEPAPILLMLPVLAGLVFRRVRSQKGTR